MLRNTSKRGTYILEATLCLPILIIAMVVMISIIQYYCCIEDAAYITAQELRRGAIEANFVNAEPLIPVRIFSKLDQNQSHVKSHLIREYKYKGQLPETDNVILLEYNLVMDTPNPIGIASRATYTVSAATRAYVGKKREIANMTVDEFMSDSSELVYVFPKDGEKYHKESCTYVKATPSAIGLSSSVREKYSSCPLCKSKTMEDGNIVYVFPDYGESFHAAGCSSIVRKYVEVERSVAIERGYSACSKCGG